MRGKWWNPAHRRIVPARFRTGIDRSWEALSTHRSLGQSVESADCSLVSLGWTGILRHTGLISSDRVHDDPFPRYFTAARNHGDPANAWHRLPVGYRTEFCDHCALHPRGSL